MSTSTTAPPADVEKASWLPLVGLFLAQVLMSFNVASLPVSLGGMVEDFDVPATSVSTAIVTYGIAVAALVMVGAKLGQRVGWVIVFRVVVAVFAVSATMMVLAPSVGWVIAAQALAGASAAIIVPSLVALIAENYRGDQQATAIGSLGSARALSGVSAFLIGGALSTLVGWRPSFLIVLALAVAVLALSLTLRGDKGDASVQIDVVGAALIGLGVISLTLGFNNLNTWGPLLATPDAPFDLAGVSPAPAMVVLGIVLGQGFFLWTRRRTRDGRTPLIALSVLGEPTERAAVYAMFVVVLLESALNFTVPLYIQIVQGRSAFSTSLAMMPFNLTVFVTATLVIRTYRRFPPRTIAVFSFCLTTAGLAWLAFVVTNNWETVPTILGLVVFGVGQGALVTLVFNVLVTSAPTTLAGDVGSIRGTTQNLASAVGTALAGVMLVSFLSLSIAQATLDHPEVSPELAAQAELDSVGFISNDHLRDALADSGVEGTDADALVEATTTARLDALRIGLLVLAGLSAIAILPASRLPRYRPEEIPDPSEA
ncbi:MFS transporter [Nocardioides sp. GY 10127]|uniref:MFS transporter n=1 Tax=Nocardioides sp. GY 10127 TaxID=2569762 RepID=UPI0010A78E63|nr:MFS transporter [Nocardioides sp. GY 10127]TIC84011.1 MFS transporter [Nocardioides sp. GY 10127]